ncbi:ActS/PrrB/RegB family redox-sensitive histidine kinase [Defluviimonas sp. WL0050]|uniref:histidine kinase n=1 Tax=Albidovulum litorale TaxID=2984134 RepID=A0ABT2ZND1_9RHOB|nr:ActS/PrrB/RegB family redox-sensitive histidine kinase [Defluviimonas sp. WL0050]MCV2872603.1 ActS/PrrB/RegB family redox-sensitive histidine kinase [Defluviimonas sp. WL0050]
MSQPAAANPGHGSDDASAVRIAHSDWVRLRTLILLRWMAVIGQATAIVVAWKYYGVDLNVTLCLAVVGAAVAANLIAIFVYPENKRLTETEAMLILLFDTAQLSLLLFLTGGLNNPFALLILAPATIAATALQTRATAFVGTVTIAFVSFVAFYHIPLRMEDGGTVEVPGVFGFGFWLAIVIGVVFLGLYARRVASEIHSMGDALLATQMALAREQKLTDLGGVVAAAAHELGTPLATIKLASAELVDELDDRPTLREDAELIRQQADRCRDILRSMGRAGKDDLHMRSAPLSAVIREAAEPHLNRGKTIHFNLRDEAGSEVVPEILRRPEIIHGLRNLVQNAVDFAEKNIWVDADWSSDTHFVRIADDGPGFPPHLMGRIGDPLMRRRRDEGAGRPGYEGMGLGLFIAKTLLERTGARLSFKNGSDPFLTEDERPERSGALVEVVWPRSAIETRARSELGENRQMQV